MPSSAHCHPENLIQVFDANLLLRQVLENGDSFRAHNYLFRIVKTNDFE